jgi:hypothetical protein
MLDDLLLKRFNLRTYNCWDLAREVWLRLTGQDLGSPTLVHYTVDEFGEQVDAWEGARFREIAHPTEPCIVLMQRPRHMPHVGVWHQRRVMHIRRAGVQYVPIEVASLGFTSVRYYVPCTQ